MMRERLHQSALSTPGAPPIVSVLAGSIGLRVHHCAQRYRCRSEEYEHKLRAMHMNVHSQLMQVGRVDF